MKLKNKKELPTDVCVVSGCRAKTDLTFVEVAHKGTAQTVPFCEKHTNELRAEPELAETVGADLDQKPAADDQALARRIEGEMTEASESLKLASDIIVTSDEEEAFVAELLGDIKSRNKKLEELKQSALKPMRDAEKVIRDWFRPVQDAYSEMERILKGRVLEYRQRLEQERQAALAAMAEAETPEEASEAIASLEGAQAPATAGLTMSKVWTYEVVDKSEVPDKYKQIDGPAINRAIRAGTREISGLRIFQKDQLGAKAS